MSTNQNIPQRNGTTQHTRLSPKLVPEYVKIDERTTSEFLAFTAEYAALIEFWNESNKRMGSWGPIFNKDISVFLAGVISTDLPKIDSEFENYAQGAMHSSREADKAVNVKSIFHFLLDLGRTFDKWVYQVQRISILRQPLESEVEIELRKVIEQNLSHSLQKLLEFGLSAKENGIIPEIAEASFEGFHPIWRIFPPEGEIYNYFKGDSPSEMLNNALVELRFIYQAFYNGLGYIISHFNSYFNKSLYEKQDHSPDIALFITFLELYKYAQTDLNLLTRRHLDFYFREILKQSPRESIPDEVHVCFELARNATSFQLPEKTLLSAGTDSDGADILFETIDDVEINKAQIAQIKSVFVSKVIENQIGTYKLVTGLYSSSVANSKDGSGAPFDEGPKDWPLFGEEQYKSGVSTMVSAKLGFAVSSPVLNLAEGNRKIRVTLRFSDASVTIYRKLLEDLSDGHSESAYKKAFFEVFGREKEAAFDIFVSGPSGWINAAEEASNEISIDSPSPWKWNEFTIAFTIPPASPPVMPLGSGHIPGENFGRKKPRRQISP